MGKTSFSYKLLFTSDLLHKSKRGFHNPMYEWTCCENLSAFIATVSDPVYSWAKQGKVRWLGHRLYKHVKVKYDIVYTRYSHPFLLFGRRSK